MFTVNWGVNSTTQQPTRRQTFGSRRQCGILMLDQLAVATAGEEKRGRAVIAEQDHSGASKVAGLFFSMKKWPIQAGA